MKIISGIQQIGIGVSDVYEGFTWYRKNFGFDIPVFDDPGWAEYLLKYTDGKPQERHAIFSMNIQGGGGLEIWQYVSRTPVKADFEIQAGDLGLYIAKIKTQDVKLSYENMKEKGIEILGELTTDPKGNECFYVKDPYGNIFQVIGSTDVFKNTKSTNGGAFGMVIGVIDMEKSIAFYTDVLDYDDIIYDEIGIFKDYKAIPGGNCELRRVLLGHSQKRKGPFSNLMGSSQIELISVVNRTPKKIYENRLWGDLGFIHLCFDIQGMKDLKTVCEKKGHSFTVDSNPDAYMKKGETFDMGDAAGHFTYVEDPDGTLIEFVETHKVPILKKIGWFIDLTKRNPEKPLPNWMLKSMSLNRVKD